MKKLKSRVGVPTYQFHGPSGQAYTRVLGAAGKRRCIYLGKHDSPESHRLFADLQVAAQAGRLEAFLEERGQQRARRRAVPRQVVESGACSIAELVARFLCWAETYYLRGGACTTELGNLKSALKPLVRLYGDETVTTFDVLRLKTLRQAIIEQGQQDKPGAGFTRTYVNGQVHRIRRVFRWGVEERLVPSAVLHELAALRSLKRGRCEGVREPKPRQPVSPAHFDAILDHVSQPVRGLLTFMWWTGARCCEATQLRGRDLDRSNPVWLFRPEFSKTEHHFEDPNAVEPIAIGPKAQAAIAAFAKLDPDLCWFSPRDAVASLHDLRRSTRATKLYDGHVARYERTRAERAAQRADPAFVEAYVANHGRKPPSPPREVYDTRGIDHAIARACKKAGIPRWSVHQLRHAALTRIRTEFGAEAAVAVARHSDATVTRTYTRESKRRLATAIAEKIG